MQSFVGCALLWAASFVSAALSQVAFADDEAVWQLPQLVWQAPHRLGPGLVFASAWMAILSAHELGHMMAARFWGTQYSWPIFVPAPTAFGTLGAVMPMTSRAPHRRALLHIAVAGPIAGALMAVPLFVWGTRGCLEPDGPLGGSGLMFGTSWLTQALAGGTPPLHPFALSHLSPTAQAGSLGLLWTSINLVPLGQLDGGHIVYAALGQRRGQAHVSWGMAAALGAFGLYAGFYWAQSAYVWTLLAATTWFLGTHHDGVQDGGQQSLTLSDWALCAGALILWLATLVVVPVWPMAMLSFGSDGFRG